MLWMPLQTTVGDVEKLSQVNIPNHLDMTIVYPPTENKAANVTRIGVEHDVCTSISIMSDSLYTYAISITFD